MALIISERDYYLVDRFLHLSNNAVFSNNPLKKIEEFHRLLNNRYTEFYHSSSHYVIDEALAHFKGRAYNFKVYMMNKPYRWGIKEYVLNSSISFYTFRSEIYLPKKEKEKHYIPNLVKRLIKYIIPPGGTLWLDNFYTSFKVMADLADL